MSYRIPVKVSFRDGTVAHITSFQDSPDIKEALEAARAAAVSHATEIVDVALDAKMLPGEGSLWTAGNCYGYVDDFDEYSIAFLTINKARDAYEAWCEIMDSRDIP